MAKNKKRRRNAPKGASLAERADRHRLYEASVQNVEHEVDFIKSTFKDLTGRQALTFAHHSAGGPIATNWDYPPDPELEPVTEVVSVHGSSEAPDTPLMIYSPAPGNFVRDVLDRGFRLGLVGSGDGHDGHPGLAQPAGIPRGCRLSLRGLKDRIQGQNEDIGRHSGACPWERRHPCRPL